MNDINIKLQQINTYQEEDEEGKIEVQPFIEINQEFSLPTIAAEIAQTKILMNTFAVSTDPDKKEKNKGMNLTTQDRPIDNIRNITFQGIG